MYQTPKTDWVAGDNFNFTDYTRIIENIKEIKNLGDIVYSNIPALEYMTPKTNYSAIPNANDFNAINDNIDAINASTYKYSLPAKVEYESNGYMPDYQAFNRMETFCYLIYNPLISLIYSLEHLEITFGRHQLGIRIKYNKDEVIEHQLQFKLGAGKGVISIWV